MARLTMQLIYTQGPKWIELLERFAMLTWRGKSTSRERRADCKAVQAGGRFADYKRAFGALGNPRQKRRLSTVSV